MKPNETIEDLKDICIELEDKGFTITLYDQPSNENRLIIRKWETIDQGDIDFLPSVMFNSYEVEEVVERIKSYLGNRLKQISMYGTPLRAQGKFAIVDLYSNWINLTVSLGDVFVNAKERGVDMIRSIEIIFNL